jgi:hypothetical protein
MKFFIRFLLSLCVFLLAGNVNPGQSRIAYLSANFLERSVSANNSATVHYDRILSSVPFPNRKSAFEKIRATEVNDDDLLKASKRNFTTYYISFFYTEPADYLCRCYNSSLPFCEHFSFVATSRFIIHRVIRI